MNASNSIYLKKIIVISPNLGHPRIINVNSLKLKKEIQIELLLITDIIDSEELNKKIKKKITLFPILEYKWKLKRILEEERKRKLTLWFKIKSIFKKHTHKQKEISEAVKKLHPRGYRGEAITSSIINIELVKEHSISDLKYLEDNYCIPEKNLTDNDVFNDLNHFFKIKIKFLLSKEILDYFKDKKFIMLDIEGPHNRINYHSIVLTKQTWENYTFIQITDTHLAERNDKIYDIVSKWLKSSIKSNTEKLFKKLKKKMKSTFKKSSDEDIKIIQKPLRKRLINPNNQLRKFIKLANKKVLKNELDFIVLTGDIIDYVIKTRYNKKDIDLNKLEFEYSNWNLFKDIILNRNIKEKYKGLIKGEELLCPIFTIVGNHDYRPNHYDLTWAGLYKKLGLNSSEAIALNELLSASPISAITKSKIALKNYLVEINSSLNYSLTLGNTQLIFLDTGSDSFKNIRDFLSGHPSVTGLKNHQIKYLENIINYKLRENENIILFMHGPPINPGKKPYLKLRIKRGKKSKIRTKIEEFRESISLNLDKKIESNRIDGLYNVKFGTISSNWEKLINFCKNYTILTLSGHTHLQKEFRLAESKKKTKVFDAPPFILKKIENPAAIYYDIYSELYTNSKDIEVNAPYIFQTPALGLGSYNNPKLAGAYRIIEIKSNKIESFKVKFIN